jgi:hypothetical protein
VLPQEPVPVDHDRLDRRPGCYGKMKRSFLKRQQLLFLVPGTLREHKYTGLKTQHILTQTRLRVPPHLSGSDGASRLVDGSLGVLFLHSVDENGTP